MTANRRSSESAPDPGRGQMSIDFLIGIGIFLATIGFVSVFITGVVTPFSENQAQPLVVNRAAEHLVEDSLASQTDPNRLNRTCTLAFFGGAGSSGCAFVSSDALTQRVGISDHWDLNITVEENDPLAAGNEILCMDPTANLQSCSLGGTKLAAGGNAPAESNSIATSIRIVSLDKQDVVVKVRLW